MSNLETSESITRRDAHQLRPGRLGAIAIAFFVTTLVTLLKYVSKEARDAAISTGMTDGMEVSFQRLDTLVAEQQGG